MNDVKDAFALTLSLKDPIASVGGKTKDTFEALGEIGAQGAACVAASASLALEATASISVSVNASASVQGKGSASSG
jgi:hypothetical protein